MLRTSLRLLVPVLLVVTAGSCNDVTGPKKTSTSVERLEQPRSLLTAESRILDAGAFHTCAVTPDTRVVCWGSNDFGQSSIPVDLPPVTQIAAGGHHTCALKTDETVSCWGLNHVGQTNVPAGLSSVTSISAGSFHNCALRSDSTVVCWGANFEGERTVPPGLSQVESISAGGAHTCAVRSDGTAVCWGRNTQRQVTIPPGLSTILEITTGADHTCALQVDQLSCWGNNDYGQGQSAPINPATIVQIAAGAWHNCVVTTEGLLRCWGLNDRGQIQAPPLDPFVSVAAGTSHSCAAMADGTVMCWGDNTYGQSTVPGGLSLVESPQEITFTSVAPNPGNVGQTYILTATGGGSGNPVTFAPLTPAVCNLEDASTLHLLSAGTCSVAANQSGGNGYAAAGQATQSFEVIAPLPLPDLAPQLSAGDALACALKNDGTVVCWGENAIQPPAGSTFVQISSGGLHSCGLEADGTILCWGQNNFGQNDVPSSLTNAVQVAAGYNHTCALRHDGTVTCWGQNTLQQLDVPAGLSSVTQISTSASHTCAVRSNGTVTCWGANSEGQSAVPLNTTTYRVVAGGYHTCAMNAGTAVCWGSNDYSQLNFSTLDGVATFELGYHFTCRLNNGAVDCWGDNSRGQATVPQFGATIEGISAGGYHACAFDSDGVVTCWGGLGGTVPTGLNIYGNQAQTINFTSSAPSPAIVGGTYSPSAAGGASGNPVVFSSLTPGVCTVSSNIVSFVAPGQCTIVANQSGGNGYVRAPEVTQSFTVIVQLTIPSIQAQITSGGFHSCAVRVDGSVTCWGRNIDGQATVPASISPVARISGGGYHNCAIIADGTVRCWGLNNLNQSTPPAGLSSVAKISAGSFHSCAIRTDASLVCWGWNALGQIAIPASLGSVVDIGSGDRHTCAVKADGTVACWGSNETNQTIVPAGLNSVVQVSSGSYHSCAVKRDGTVVCWGENGHGQLAVPSSLNSVVEVAAGARYSCARKSDGTIVCWGSNDEAQQNIPGAATSLVQISTGYFHTCSLKADGVPVCWGGSGDGQSIVPAGLNLNQRLQVITFSAAPSPATMGTSFTASASGGGSGNPVTFTSLTTNTCAVSGAQVSLVAIGTCTLGANQAGSPDYAPATQVTQSFEVSSPFKMLSRCGHAITGIAFDGTDYFVGEGHNGLDQCVTRYSQDGILRDTRHFQIDMRGLHYVPATGFLTSRTWAGQISSMSYSAGTQQTITPFVAAPGVDQSQPAVDTDGAAFWLLNVPSQLAELHRVSDDVMVRSFGVTGGLTSAPAIAVSDALVFIPNGTTVRGYDKVTGDLVSAITLPSSSEGCNGYGFGASTSGDRIMYSETCSVARVHLISPPGSQTIAFTSTPPANAVIAGSYTVAATGGASGNPVTFTSSTASVCSVDGSQVTFSAVGACTIAAHQAGGNNYLRANVVSQTFNIVYQFTGFAAPIANAPAVNNAKAGSIVRIQFSLGGDQGMDVIAAGFPRSGILTGPCNASGTPASITPATAGASLRYDPSTGQYAYSWQTDVSWAGTCRQFSLMLTDGTVHLAHIQFDAITKPSAVLKVSPSTVTAGVQTDVTFTLDVASPVAITGIQGIPCQLPAIQPGATSYNGSCVSSVKYPANTGKVTYVATVGLDQSQVVSNSVTITVPNAPLPTVQLSASKTTMRTNSVEQITMNVIVTSLTPILYLDNSSLSGQDGSECVFPPLTPNATSYAGTCTFNLGPFAKPSRMVVTVAVEIDGRSGLFASNAVVFSITK